MRVGALPPKLRACVATSPHPMSSTAAAFVSSFWLQAGTLAVLLLVLHVVGDWRDTGAPPRRWRQWREAFASIVVCVALFGVVTGGRGCTAGRDDGEAPLEEPHPPGKG